MKKKALLVLVGIIGLSITAYSIIDWKATSTNEKKTVESNAVAMNEPIQKEIVNKIFNDFIYDVGPRFNHISKADLAKVKSFDDFIGPEHAQRVLEYKTVSVIIMKGDEKSNSRDTGKGGDLIPSQLKFMQSLEYSTNILVWADLIQKHKETGVIEDTHWTPYLTIVPEKQAEYAEGKEALKTFLRDHSKAARDQAKVDPEKLKPAKLFFTVTKTGSIENIKLDRSSNYPLVDKTMIELIGKTQGNWMPAENTEGEKVDQELVVSFGLIGC